MERLITDELWEQFEPLIPKHPKSRRGGRPRKDDRDCLEGMAYMLRCGVAWHLFPSVEFGVSKSTCFDRFAGLGDEGGVFRPSSQGSSQPTGIGWKDRPVGGGG